MAEPHLTNIIEKFKSLQDKICLELEVLEGNGQFKEDLWHRRQGGGGRSRVIQGNHIEKGGVMYSHVHGELPEVIAKSLEMPGGSFNATGVSIVLHPLNPWVPIIHMNVRYFETEGGKWWFGGGIDVTPHYINVQEAVLFHSLLSSICSDFDPYSYLRYKKWADDYFYNLHRKETRGIGGIFFDRLNDHSGRSKSECWQFVQSVGDSFIECYKLFFNSNFKKKYTDTEIEWRNIRRGRYVEFNLVYDRGTKFGLETDGRVESILMSMPPQAVWLYDYHPMDGTKEAHTLSFLRKGIDWLTYTEE